MLDSLHHIPLLGSLTNALAIVFGTGIGLVAKKSFSHKCVHAIINALGLFTLILGISMGIKSEHVFIVIFSLVSGALVGEFCKLESWFLKAGSYIKTKVKSDNNTFIEGFVTPSLLYCTGSMAVLGSFQEGLGNFPELLMAKAAMDGILSIAFAASLGMSVLFSAVPVFLYQGALTLFSGTLQGILSENVITEISAVGGILLVGVSLSILELKHISVMNILPSMLICGILCYIVAI